MGVCTSTQAESPHFGDAPPPHKLNTEVQVTRPNAVAKAMGASGSACCGTVGFKDVERNGHIVRVATDCPRTDNTPYRAAVNAGDQGRVRIVVNTSTSAFYSPAYTIQFFNSDDQLIGEDGAVPFDGCNVNSHFGPICTVAQKSLNVAYVKIINPNRFFTIQVNSVTVERVPDKDVRNTGATVTASAPGLKSGVTVSGALGGSGDVAGQPGESYRLHLEKGQKVMANGWASADNPRTGAVFRLQVLRQPTDDGAEIAICAPYDTPASFRGGFINQGDAADFYVRAICTWGRICKFKAHLSMESRPDLPTYAPTDCKDCDGKGPNGPGKNQPVRLNLGREQSEFAPDLVVPNRVGPSVSWGRTWHENLSAGPRIVERFFARLDATL